MNLHGNWFDRVVGNYTVNCGVQIPLFGQSTEVELKMFYLVLQNLCFSGPSHGLMNH